MDAQDLGEVPSKEIGPVVEELAIHQPLRETGGGDGLLQMILDFSFQPYEQLTDLLVAEFQDCGAGVGEIRPGHQRDGAGDEKTHSGGEAEAVTNAPGALLVNLSHVWYI